MKTKAAKAVKNQGISIQRNVPIPAGAQGPVPKYPFRNMEVGDSFFVEADKTRIATIRTSAHLFGRCNEATFRTVSVTEGGKSGIRIWKTA